MVAGSIPVGARHVHKVFLFMDNVLCNTSPYNTSLLRGEFSLGAVIINVSWGNFAAFVKSHENNFS